MSTRTQPPPRGRPRSFDRAEALRRALGVFLARGYDGASMAHLTEAMDINSPSLYAAFGSKEDLFREAAALYISEFGAPVWGALTTKRTAREAVEALLRSTVELFTKPGNPRACLLVTSMLSCQEPRVRNFAREKRRASLAALRRRIEQGVEDGDVPRHVEIDAVVEFYGLIQQGLSLRARDGVSRETLLKVVRAALAAWTACVGAK